MKVVILAGGMGTRISEESHLKPKPMIEIGTEPILWHILKIYAHQGFNDFIICCGYKGEVIRNYFLNYNNNHSDFTIDVATNTITTIRKHNDDFKVTLLDTGLNTNTAGRVKQVEPCINNETFLMTYGDGVADVDLKKLIDFHSKNKKLATLTSAKLPSRFGNIDIGDNNIVNKFREKPQDEEVWINAGFFVLEPGIFNYLKGDMNDTQWEMGPLNEIADDKQLVAYKHNGFWKCMDAIRDKTELETIWQSGKAPWKIWK